MATYLVLHEVDDIDHWLKQTTPYEVFGSTGASHRTSTDPQGSNRVGLIFERNRRA